MAPVWNSTHQPEFLWERILFRKGTIKAEKPIVECPDPHDAGVIFDDADHVERINASFRHVAQGKALKLVIGNGPSQPAASREAIAKAIARARSWYEMIVPGRVSGLLDICSQHGLTHRYVKNIFPLAFLSPESIEFLLNSPLSQGRTLDSLIGRMPMSWNEQRVFLRSA